MNVSRPNHLFGIRALGLLLLLLPALASAQTTFNGSDFHEVVSTIEKQTAYRFLYREALVSDLRFRFSAPADSLLFAFNGQLKPYNLSLEIDTRRKQVLLIRKVREEEEAPAIIDGYVVDDSDGDRLPFATLRWRTSEGWRGVAANEAGYFSLRALPQNENMELHASYVGYEPITLSITATSYAKGKELTVRLRPKQFDSKEIRVYGASYYNPLDSGIARVVDIGAFSPLGESNTVRSLQQLPSVTLNTLVNDGINIRGSTSDGLMVLLDGMPVFNQSHLFGMVDSFNKDALRTGGFFYGITPAEYQAPPGGTLDLITRAAGLNRFQANVGISNTAANATVEAPLANGSGSLLLSGRHSFMNQLNWLGNEDLVAWGLNINRENSLGEELLASGERLTNNGPFSARFYDLHSKLLLEGTDGGRLTVSGYLGGDDSEMITERIQPGNLGTPNRLFRDFETRNSWQSASGSATYQAPITKSIYSKTMVGISEYQTDYLKEDFVYNSRLPDVERPAFQLDNFESDSRFSITKLQQQLVGAVPGFGTVTGGMVYQRFRSRYRESTPIRPSFANVTRAGALDLFAQIDYSAPSLWELRVGSRLHYYSNGNYLKWSPRFRALFTPHSALTFHGGYSRNFQFLHRISLYNQSVPSFWVLSTQNQPPTTVDYFTTGLDWRPTTHWFVQLEGFWKEMSNLRIHEVNTLVLGNIQGERPWLFDNNGQSKGVELMVQYQTGPFRTSHAYTLSETLFSNDRIRNGAEYPADYDRRHQYSSTLEYRTRRGVKLYVNWNIASGVPNRQSLLRPNRTAERLDLYHRLDLALEYEIRYKTGNQLRLHAAIYNAYNRQNPWYRERVLALQGSSGAIDRNDIQPVEVDVFDLGFQPSFSISYSF